MDSTRDISFCLVGGAMKTDVSVISSKNHCFARYLWGIDGSDRTVWAFCFINAASRYHSSPAKQRTVRKHDRGGSATQGRFPPLPMKKPRNACVSEASITIKGCYKADMLINK